MGWLAQRYRVHFDRGLFDREGFLAGSDARRREELARALERPGVRAIFAARGGCGASRFVHAIDWGALARDPRWIIGFSDITALHVEASRVAVASAHGAHVTSLGRGDHHARAALLRVLEEPAGARRFAGLATIRPGAAEGPLYGGNLTVLHACAAAGRLRVPEGAILLLEDVTERPYRIDRCLATLEAGGHLAPAAAIVLGDFEQCDPGPDGVTAAAVLRERLLPLGVPVVAGLPVGHGRRNEPVILGGRAAVDARPAGASVLLAGG
jgi:muramoyltetrapeptide carboxypeptidase